MAQKRYPTQRDGWHPILAAEEYQVGHWVMLTQYSKPYAMIDLVRRGDEVGYKVTDWQQDSADRKTLGYFKTLRAAAAMGHAEFIRGHTPHNQQPLAGHDYTRGIPGSAS